MIIDTKISAVGVIFYSLSTKRHLYLMRNDKKYFGHWALPGGKIEPKESLMTAIERECTEEMGKMPDYVKIIPVEKYTATGNYFSYHTFFCIVEDEFSPVLNHEHVGYAWIDANITPKPLHPGYWATLKAEDIHKKIEVLTSLYITE